MYGPSNTSDTKCSVRIWTLWLFQMNLFFQCYHWSSYIVVYIVLSNVKIMQYMRFLWKSLLIAWMEWICYWRCHFLCVSGLRWWPYTVLPNSIFRRTNPMNFKLGRWRKLKFTRPRSGGLIHACIELWPCTMHHASSSGDPYGHIPEKIHR